MLRKSDLPRAKHRAQHMFETKSQSNTEKIRREKKCTVVHFPHIICLSFSICTVLLMVLSCVVRRSHNQSAMFLRWNEQSVWLEKKQHHGTWNGCLGPEYTYWMNRDIFMRCKYRIRSTSSALDFHFKIHFFSFGVSGDVVEVNVAVCSFLIEKKRETCRRWWRNRSWPTQLH